jgi:hypothetical protein
LKWIDVDGFSLIEEIAYLLSRIGKRRNTDRVFLNSLQQVLDTLIDSTDILLDAGLIAGSPGSNSEWTDELQAKFVDSYTAHLQGWRDSHNEFFDLTPETLPEAPSARNQSLRCLRAHCGLTARRPNDAVAGALLRRSHKAEREGHSTMGSNSLRSGW